MKKINEYVNSVYKHVGGNQKEVNELKEEMKSHLIEIVHEFQQEGMSESEAVDMAIKRFGERNEVEQALLEVFKKEKIFAQWLLKIAIVSLILAGGMFLLSRFSLISVINFEGISRVNEVIEDSAELTTDVKLEIEEILSKLNTVMKLDIYDVRDLDLDSNDIEYWHTIQSGEVTSSYHYQKSSLIPKWITSNYSNVGTANDTWCIYYETFELTELKLTLLVVSLSIYVTLFTIWAVINAYHHKRLNMGWIIIFAVFNVIGYWIYRLCGKMKR